MLWLVTRREPPRDLGLHERHVTRRSVFSLAKHDARAAFSLLVHLVVLALLSARVIVREHELAARVLLHLDLLIRNHVKDGALGQPLLFIFLDLRD